MVGREDSYYKRPLQTHYYCADSDLDSLTSQIHNAIHRVFGALRYGFRDFDLVRRKGW